MSPDGIMRRQKSNETFFSQNSALFPTLMDKTVVWEQLLDIQVYVHTLILTCSVTVAASAVYIPVWYFFCVLSGIESLKGSFFKTSQCSATRLGLHNVLKKKKKKIRITEERHWSVQRNTQRRGATCAFNSLGLRHFGICLSPFRLLAIFTSIQRNQRAPGNKKLDLHAWLHGEKGRRKKTNTPIHLRPASGITLGAHKSWF